MGRTTSRVTFGERGALSLSLPALDAWHSAQRRRGLLTNNRMKLNI